MKRLIYILAVVSLVVMASGCTSDQWASNKTYSVGGLTFQYPGTWSENSTEFMSNPSGATGIAAVGTDDEGFAVGSVSTSILSESDLQQVISQMIQTYKNQGFTTEKNITVDGVSATLLSTPNKLSEGYYASIAFWTKTNKLYFAIYGSKTSSDTTSMERILGSLKAT